MKTLNLRLSPHKDYIEESCPDEDNFIRALLCAGIIRKTFNTYPPRVCLLLSTEDFDCANIAEYQYKRWLGCDCVYHIAAPVFFENRRSIVLPELGRVLQELLTTSETKIFYWKLQLP